jgi:hypothetical protein
MRRASESSYSILTAEEWINKNFIPRLGGPHPAKRRRIRQTKVDGFSARGAGESR